MPVRTCVLTASRATATVAGQQTVAYTCPVGKTAIVKEVILELFDGAGSAFLEVEHVGGFQTRMINPGLVVGTPHRSACWTVLEPGDTLVLGQAANTGQVRWHISGTELDGVAP